MIHQIDTSAAAPISNGRIAWSGGPVKTQIFSLPDNIIYYMIQNPSSPKAYLKLAMSCKYCFKKKPLLIVKRILYGKFCSSKDWEECNKQNGNCCIEIDLAKLTTKIWLAHQYYFTDASFINALFPQRLYKCENALFQTNFDLINFENFKLVSSLFHKFCLSRINMVDKGVNDVLLDQILGSLTNVKEFLVSFNSFFDSAFTEVTVFTMKNMCKLENLGSLRLFRLFNISELINVKDLKNFIIKQEETKFWLHFRYDISDEYQVQLGDLCDTVIAAKACNCVILYDGQDEKKLTFMRERYNKNKDADECFDTNHKCCVDVDLAKLTSKIWLTHQYALWDIPSFIAFFSQKLYKCKNSLFLCISETVVFDNFKLAASCFEKFWLFAVTMIDKDGDDVMLEEILGSLPNVKEFDYTFKISAHAATALTMKKMCKLDNLDDLRLFYLYDIPHLFNVKDIENFIMKHQNTKFWFHFRKGISPAYRIQLDGLCNAVIAAKACMCVVEYFGQDERKLDIMRVRYYK